MPARRPAREPARERARASTRSTAFAQTPRRASVFLPVTSPCVRSHCFENPQSKACGNNAIVLFIRLYLICMMCAAVRF